MRLTQMSPKDFNRLSAFIQSELGIKMPGSKRPLLESRLQKRLRSLGMGSFGEYCDFLFSPDGLNAELVHMIDLVTTNKTDFFREPQHFEYLLNYALPELVRTWGAGLKKSLVIWSAGCSSGEEPYTLAMVLSEFAQRHPGLGFDFSIIATDISTRVLQAASKGIYHEERITPVPVELRRRHLLRSRDNSAGLVRISPELRERVRFRRLNFMDDDFGFREQLDIIFCRNVIIYFDKETQKRLFEKFCECLGPGRYLCIGLSETLNGLDLPLVKVASSIYRKI
ncbi:MAG: chemotaxis protein CheR [Deltaproteobacteria bacterium]|nr:chemotaxis protein CheR [Deltaproteobacteria bacterium]